MKILFRCKSIYVWLCVVFVAMQSSAFAQNIAVRTEIPVPAIEMGQTVDVAILLDLNGVASIGGYIDVVYDQAYFDCISVQNHDLFGAGQALNEPCSDTLPLRISSMSSSLADVSTFPNGQEFATITLQAKATISSTNIHFATTTQIFGTRGGNVLSELNYDATQDLEIVMPLSVTLTLPESGTTLSDEFYTFEWQIENMLTTSIEFTLHVSANWGENWTLITSSANPADSFLWGLSDMPNGENYIVQANISTTYQYFEMISGTFAINLPDPVVPVPPESPAVPEPGTLLLLVSGLIGMFWLRKRNRAS